MFRHCVSIGEQKGLRWARGGEEFEEANRERAASSSSRPKVHPTGRVLFPTPIISHVAPTRTRVETGWLSRFDFKTVPQFSVVRISGGRFHNGLYWVVGIRRKYWKISVFHGTTRRTAFGGVVCGSTAVGRCLSN
jgi:hypothetical protein